MMGLGGGRRLSDHIELHPPGWNKTVHPIWNKTVHPIWNQTVHPDILNIPTHLPGGNQTKKGPSGGRRLA